MKGKCINKGTKAQTERHVRHCNSRAVELRVKIPYRVWIYISAFAMYFVCRYRQCDLQIPAQGFLPSRHVTYFLN